MLVVYEMQQVLAVIDERMTEPPCETFETPAIYIISAGMTSFVFTL